MRSIASRHAAPKSGEKLLLAKDDDMMTRTNNSKNGTARSDKKQKGGPLRQLQLLRIKWNLLKTKQKLIMIIAMTCFHIFFVYNLQVSFMIPSTSSSRIRQHPRILYLHTIENKNKYPHRKVEDEWAYNADIDHGYEEFEEGDCKAMHQWQVESYPSCNLIHETDMLSYTYITSGGYRDVWYTHDNDGSRYVVKSLVWDGTDFRVRDKERHRRDANAYSMLQSSDHVMNIYGYCVNGAIFDYADKGTLENALIREEEHPKWTSDEKLLYAWQVMKALTDLHGVGNIHDSAAISHTDMTADQYLWFDGKFRLNDFNRARFIRWNEKKQEACPFWIAAAPGKHRSPEEYKEDLPLTEKIDVYSAGNILWQILVGSEEIPLARKSKDAKKQVIAGDVHISEESFKRKLDDKEKTILNAKEMCHIYDPKKRRTAAEVEKYLRSSLEKFGIDYKTT